MTAPRALSPPSSGEASPTVTCTVTVYSENLTGALYLDKTLEIEAYSGAWAAISDAALTKHDTIAMLKDYLRELNDRER